MFSSAEVSNGYIKNGIQILPRNIYLKTVTLGEMSEYGIVTGKKGQREKRSLFFIVRPLVVFDF